MASVLKHGKNDAFVYDQNQVVKRNHLMTKANEREYALELECIKPIFKADQLEIDKIQEKWLEHLQTNKLNPMSTEGL